MATSILYRLSAFALVALLAACGGGGDASEAQPPQALPLTMQCGQDLRECVGRVAAGRLTITSPAYNVRATSELIRILWSNASNGAVTVRIDHSLQGMQVAASGSSGEARYEYRYLVSSEGVSKADVSGDCAATEAPFAISQAVTVPAGATLEVKLVATATLTEGSEFSNQFRSASTSIVRTP